MSMKITRALACDGIGCRVMSLDVLRTIDADVPDWQGWQVFEPTTDNPTPGYAFDPHFVHPRHLCPACVAAGNHLEPPPIPVPV